MYTHRFPQVLRSGWLVLVLVVCGLSFAGWRVGARELGWYWPGQPAPAKAGQPQAGQSSTKHAGQSAAKTWWTKLRGLDFSGLGKATRTSDASAFSTTYTFNGTTDTDWANASNWDTGVAPTSALLASGDAVIIAANCVMNDVTIAFPSGTSLTVNSAKALSPSLNTFITINAGATLTVNASGSLSQGRITNAGTMDIYGSYTAYYMTNNSGGMLNIKSGGSYSCPSCAETINSGSTINNDGTMNTGTPSTWQATVNNNATGVITDTGGNGSQLNFGASSTVNNYGSLVSRTAKTAGTFINYSTGTLSMPQTCNFTVQSGGAFTNGGTITLGNSDNFFNLNAGGTLTNNGAIQGKGTLVQSGTLTNSATGIIAPGISPGKLSVTGDLDLGSATYNCEINGTVQGTGYDWLAVSNNATLTNAKLVVNWGSFTPSAGQTYTVMSFASRTGTFSSVTIPSVNGLTFTTNYTATAVTISVALVNNPPTVASDAGSKLFIGRFGQNAIARANIDGTGVIPNAITSSGTVLGFALDQTRGKIYWTDFTANGHIGRANMDGTGLEPNFISGAVFPNEIAVDSATGQIYWSQATGGNAATNGVWRANADGTGVTQFLTITGGDYGIDVAGGKLYYFPNNGTRNLSRINLDGTGSVPNFLPAVGSGSGTSGLAVDTVNQKIYFGTSTGSTIGCANLDGTGINLNFTTTGGAGNDPAELAVDGTGGYLYYTAYRTGNIGRVALNGSNNNTAFITSLTGTGVVINYGLDIGSADFEAAQATRTGTYSDPDGNTVTITADIGSVTKTGTSSGTWTWTYTPPDGPATVNVTITATDSNNGTSTTNFTFAALNVSPTIALTGNAAVDVNTSYTLNLGTITDPGTDTVTAYSINWGDGVTEPFSGIPTGLNKTHTYTTGGSQTITVSLTDEDGTFTSGTKTITVNTPVLAVSKSQPSPSLTVGQNSTYTITVTNSGSAPATAATVKDVLPAGMKLISATGTNWTCTPSSGNAPVGTITCTFSGTLAATNGTSTISVVVCPTAGGSVTNKVSIDPTSDTNAPDPTTCTALNTPSAGCGAPVTSTANTAPTVASDAGSKLFIARPNGASSSVARVSTSGTGLALNAIPATVSIYGVAVDSVHGKIYYTAHTADRLKRANLDGTSVEDNFIVLPSGSGALDVEVDVVNGYLYWTEAYTGTAGIWRANLDGTGITQILSKAQVYSLALNVAGNKIYYGLDGNFSIGRCDLNGANNNPGFLGNVGGGGVSGVYGLAVDSTNGKLYWNRGNGIGQANLDGSSIVNPFITLTSGSLGIVADPVTSKLFWTSNGGGKAGCANLNGTGVNESLVTGLTAAWFIDLASTDFEGTQATRTGTYSDPDGNPVTISTNIGSVTQTGTSSGTWTWTYTPPDGPTTVNVTITATDSNNAQSTTSFVDTVLNVAPTIALTGNAAVDVNTSYTLNLGTITDPGTDTVTAYSINWGDGVTEPFSGNPANTSKTHTYATGGSQTITVSLTDEDGTFTSGTKTITVNTPVLAVSKSQPSPSLTVGQNSTYTITVTNSGSAPATAATVKDAIPAGMKLISATGTNWTCTPSSGNAPVGTITCTFAGTLAATNGSSTISVVVCPTAGGSVTNKVSIDPTSGTNAPDPTTCTALNTPSAGCGAPVTSTANTAPTVATDAGSKIFVARYNGGNFIARANVDGTGLNVNQFPLPNNAIGVVVDTLRGKLYWASISGSIGQMNLDGSGANASFVTGLSGPIGLAIDSTNGFLYIADQNGGIKRVGLDGTGLTTILATGQVQDVALDVPNNKLYYCLYTSGAIGRANLDGSGHNPSFLPTGGSGRIDGIGIDLVNGKIYWTDPNHKLGRANLDGTSVQTSFISLVGFATDVIVDPQGSKVYWTSGGTAAVGRANLDGTGTNESFLTGIPGAWGIAIGDVDTEGALATRTGTYSDPDGNTVTLSVTSGPGTVTKTGTSSGTWTWTYTPPDGPVTHNVTITATDSNNATSTTSFTINVNNIAPTIALTGNAAVDVNTGYTLNLGTITDPGTDTVTAYSINWGDGVTEPFSGNPANTSKTHTYTTGGSQTITVSLTDEDGTFTSGTKTITVNTPVLAVSKSQPSPALVVGQNSTYTLTVTNSGGAAATAATVKEAIPAGMKLISASGSGWTCTPSSGNPNVGTITCSFSGTIAATNGSSTISVVVCPTATGSATNYVSVDPTSGTNAPDPTTCTALNAPTAGCGAPVTSTVTGVPNLTVSKSQPSPSLVVGQNSTYTITVTNSGSLAATTATVKEAIPAGMKLISASGTGWTCTPSSGNPNVGTITCTFAGTIAATNGTSTISVVVCPTAVGSVTNYVSVDPTSGTNAPDPTTCTALNTPTAGCGAPVTSSGSALGAALNFDGVNDVVSIPHNAAFNITSLTAEGWIKTTATPNQAGIINKYFISSGNGWQVLQNGSNIEGYVFTQPGAVHCDVTSSGQAVNDGNWHHIAFSVDNNGGKIFIDGILRGSATWSGTPGTITNTLPVSLGWYNGFTGYFNGCLDDVRIWNRALCQDEIQAHMNCELMATETGLLAYYKFNQGLAGGTNTSITTLTDSGPNHFDGTLNNFALSGATSNWVTPGGDTTGATCTVFTAPEIDVLGNSTSIADGDITPSATDDTDFGSANVASGSVTHSFTIANTGTRQLLLGGTPKVAISGTNASDFTVTVQPTSPVAVTNGTTTFTIVFDPSGVGTRTATVTIENDDCDEGPYNFSIQGTGLNQPPTITAGTTITRQQGTAGSGATIATVSDDLTAAGSIVVTATTVPTGISITGISNSGGTISATVAALCNATPGDNTVVLTATDGNGGMATANFIVTVTANSAPTVGTYANTGVAAGGNVTVTPNASPADNGSIASVTATALPNTFTGSFSGNTATGALTITNAGPSGSYTITVTVTDNCGATVTKQFALTVNTAPTINAVAATRQQGSPTSNSTIATVSDVDQTAGSLTVTVTSANPSNGVTVSNLVNTNGTITADVVASCTATNASFTLTVTDGSNATATATLNVTVTANTAPTLSYANQSAAAGGSLSVSPTTASDNGSIASFALQSQGGYTGTISVNPTTGVVSLGNISPTGGSTITIHATDNCGLATDASFTLNVNCAAITVTAPATNTGTANAAFSQTFTQSGGIGTTTFSTMSTLPTGLTLSSAGVLSGTPTQTGTFPITVKATDANGCMGTVVYTLTINCQTITVTAPATNTGTAGVAFSQTFTQSGGIGATTFSTTSTLPSGITLSSGGVLGGTTAQPGTFPITVKATDSNGCMGTASYTLTIGCAAITVSPATLTAGTVNAAFNQSVTASPANSYSYAVTSGALPGGLNLSSSTGAITGTPTAPGNFGFTITATLTSAPNFAAPRTLASRSALFVPQPSNCSGSQAYTLTINCQTITVTAPAITSGTAGTAFSQTFTQAGGSGTTNFTTASALPSGVTLSAGGALAGTPTQTGTFPITVKATDANGCMGTASYTLTINCQAITVGPFSIVSGNPGVPYSQQFTQAGGIGTVTFSTSSTLPTGITLSTSGLLAGTTSQTGSFPITIKATDANGCMGTASYTLALGCPTITVTPPVVTTGTAGAAFSQSFSQSGGTVGTTFSTGSTLPNGLTLSSAGTLSGTPTQTGTFPIMVTATSSGGCNGMANYTLTINCQTITVTPPATTTGTASVAFNQSFTQANAIGGATFSLASGSLPPGLTLAANGTLSGTPSQAGNFSFAVKATDANGCTGTSATYNLTINCPTITLSPSSATPPTDLPGGQAGVAYNQAVSATPNGTAYAYAVTAGALPAGLTLHTASGTISGTTNLVGTFSFTVTATGWGNCTGSRQYRLTTACPTITLSSLSGGTAGTAYNQTLTATPSGGSYSFAVTTGSLPPGLSLNASTGAVTGTPTQAGTFSFTVTATGFGNCTGAQAYSLVIGCPTIAVTPTSLPNATANASYSQTLGATPPGTTYSFSVTTGSLPSGLTLNSSTGAISGSPTQGGTFNFRVTAKGWGDCTGFRDYQLTVGCPAITVTPASLPGGTIGTAYDQSVGATPAGTYSYGVSTGALPTGLTLNASSGAISGTPTTAGTFNFTIKALSGGGGTCSSTRNYTVTIACQTFAVSTTTLPSGNAGSAYSHTLNVTPAGSYTFSLAQGNLPTGLVLAPATGVISGLPSVTGTSSFMIKVKSANGCDVTQTLSITINCPATVVVAPASLPNGTVGTLYNQSFSATPSGGGYAFTLASGALPTGLALNPGTGVLSGMPTANGTFSFTIRATGFGSCTGSKAYTVVIGSGSCPTITLPELPNGSVGQLYNSILTASPAGSYSYAVASGSLPPGVQLYDSFGLMYGYPGVAGTYNFSLRATDANNCAGSRSYAVVISAAVIQLPTFNDFTGDHRSEFVLWRQAEGQWLIIDSASSAAQTTQWGGAGDVAVQGDYDGDGKADLAAFGKDGHWRIKLSRDGATLDKAWGLGTDVAVPGDYDGDGKTDLAVWRGAETAWYIQRSSDGQTESVQWGTSLAPYYDVPVPGDYDGDGKTDVAVFRRGNGHWYIKRSSDGQTVDKAWGVGTDVAVPGDYDGDGKTDIAVWRGAEGAWYIVRSSDSEVESKVWGSSLLPYSDVPAVGDYDGDGKADISVWRKTEGRWYVLQSSDGTVRTVMQGRTGD